MQLPAVGAVKCHACSRSRVFGPVNHDSPVSNMERAAFYLGSSAGRTVLDTTLLTGKDSRVHSYDMLKVLLL